MPPETVSQIHERIWNPLPVITHCPCGHALGKCLTADCEFVNHAHFAEFLKTTPEWFVRALAERA